MLAGNGGSSPHMPLRGTANRENPRAPGPHHAAEGRHCREAVPHGGPHAFGAEQVLAFVDLLERPSELHERIPESMRRDLLLAFLSKLRVYDDPEGLRIDSERTETNDTPHIWQSQQHLAATDHVMAKRREPPAFLRKALLLRPPRASTSPMV
jgi:hypothetical protein